MRKDMAKRFLENRDGKKGRFPRHCKQYSKIDEDGQHINNPHGMKKAHQLTVKNEDRGDTGTDFSVLRRFLQSRVGQPWDKVYSEICSEADCRSFQGYHLRDWLGYVVEQKCSMDGEKVVDQHGIPLGRSWRRGEFFVHPETRLLEYVKAENSNKGPTIQKVFELDGMLYHEYDGVWYRVKMEELRMVSTRSLGISFMIYDEWDGLKDVMIHNLIKYYPWNVSKRLEKEYGRSPNKKVWYCVWKQSANSKEITKLKKKRAA